MYTLYSMQRSGNCYKVRLALAQLDIPYGLIEIDILQGETRTPEFLAKNPSGHVPLLEVAPGRYLAESNAILWYIAGHTPLHPTTASIAPRCCNGCSSSSTASSPISAPLIPRWSGTRTAHALGRLDCTRKGYHGLLCGRVMENHLNTIVLRRQPLHRRHIALYAYTHLAHLCGSPQSPLSGDLVGSIARRTQLQLPYLGIGSGDVAVNKARPPCTGASKRKGKVGARTARIPRVPNRPQVCVNLLLTSKHAVCRR